MEFTSWDATIRPDELEHHGIKGMAWGVRRYQNEDGSLTPAGRERYGVSAVKRTSARKMQKDFNRLDQGYANVSANQRLYQKKVAKLSRKGHKAERKGKTEKAKKLLAKALKYGQAASLNNKQKKAIEALQWKIIGKAANAGYTTTSQAVKRTGLTTRGRAAMAIGRHFGVVGGAIAGGYAAKNSLRVDGQKVRISKRGNGGTSIVNYANANKYSEEERRRERSRSMAGVRR